MKLRGIKVVDFSSFLPGPYLTMTMADHGAEVIKVEPAGGDPARHIGLSDGPVTVFFRNLNRGKKSIVLDLKTEAGRAAALDLTDKADVVVETFRPGVADRLGIGYEVVSRRNPRIVYCSISAFGQDGPYRDRPAHDLALQAVSGVLSLTRGQDDQPAMPSLAAADYLSALQGLSGVLMALLARERSGRGDYLDIAMHDSTLAACANLMGPTFAENRQPMPNHERTTGGSAFYQVYATRDGRHIVLAGQETKFVANLLNALGRPELIPLCETPGPHQQPVIDLLRDVFARQTLNEAIAFLAPLDVCFGPVNNLPEAFQDPNALARGMVLRDREGRRHIAPAIRFRHEPPEPDLRAPALNEHGDEHGR